MVVDGLGYEDDRVRAREFGLRCNVTVQVFVQLNTAYSRIVLCMAVERYI
jgi:hypothetical protein